MKRILIIEDNAVLTSIYQKQYRSAGYDVAIAADGEIGLSKITSFRPDLVQVDLLIPKINGVELIRRIRIQPGLRELPIIVLTSCYHELTVKQAWAAGANHVASKLNTSPKILLEYIENYLRKPQAAPGDLTAPKQEEPNIRQQFTERVPHFQAEMRTSLQEFIKTQGNERMKSLDALYQTTRALVGHAGMCGYVAAFQLGAALEGLMKDLQAKPEQITASVTRTIANAFDCLMRILNNIDNLHIPVSMTSLILCVDDEPISRQLISKALMRVDLKPLSLDNPNLALQILSLNQFDLVFLDIDMPGMDGFELCKELRALPANRKTPVVFVTTSAGFDSRARSVLSGGNDLIAKPFLMMELAVKALTYIANAKFPAADQPQGG